MNGKEEKCVVVEGQKMVNGRYQNGARMAPASTVSTEYYISLPTKGSSFFDSNGSEETKCTEEPRFETLMKIFGL